MFVNWFILLFKGRTPEGLHNFIAGYLRYLTHLEAYFLLAANPFPGFYPFGERKPYPVDLHIDPPERQNRWKVFFRLFLAIPALAIGSTLMFGGPRSGSYFAGGLAFLVAFLAWFVGHGARPVAARHARPARLLPRVRRPALGVRVPDHRPVPVRGAGSVRRQGRGDRGAGPAGGLGARDRPRRG